MCVCVWICNGPFFNFQQDVKLSDVHLILFIKGLIVLNLSNTTNKSVGAGRINQFYGPNSCWFHLYDVLVTVCASPALSALHMYEILSDLERN